VEGQGKGRQRIVKEEGETFSSAIRFIIEGKNKSSSLARKGKKNGLKLGECRRVEKDRRTRLGLSGNRLTLGQVDNIPCSMLTN